jgi:hypothetical protein
MTSIDNQFEEEDLEPPLREDRDEGEEDDAELGRRRGRGRTELGEVPRHSGLDELPTQRGAA